MFHREILPAHCDPPIVCDAGSHTLRHGFATDDNPSFVLPSFVGLPKGGGGIGFGPENGVLITHESRFFGADAIRHRGILRFRYPIQNGVVQHSQDFESLLNHALGAMNIDLVESAANRPFFVTHAAPLGSKSSRVLRQTNELAQLLFESFSAPAICLPNPESLLFATAGMSSGVGVSIGSGSIRVCPVSRGRILSLAHRPSEISPLNVNVGMTDVRDRLIRLLTERRLGFSESESDHRMFVQEKILEKGLLCASPCVRSEVEVPLEGILGRRPSFVLKDETTNAPEVLFQPSLCDYNLLGLSEVIRRGVRLVKQQERCEEQVSPFVHVFLSGGGALLEGISERIQSDLEGEGIRVIVLDNPLTATWRGASVVAAAENARIWVTKELYEEFGSDVMGPMNRLETSWRRDAFVQACEFGEACK